MRILFVCAAVLSLFIFPWPFALILGTIAAVYLPGAALGLGVLYDVLYFPGGTWPLATILGFVGTGVALLVRRFVKTRIMGA